MRDELERLRVQVDKGRQATLDQVADMVVAHAKDELAKLEQTVEQRVVQLVGERFMEIQRRVDLNTEHLQDRMTNVVYQNEEAIKVLKDDQTKAQEAQDQLQAQGQDLTKKMIRMQTKAAVQQQYLAAQAKILKKNEAEQSVVADVAHEKAQKTAAKSKRRADAK